MPYFMMYQQSLQHAFTNEFYDGHIAYVGNSSNELAGTINENTPLPGANGGGGCPCWVAIRKLSKCRRPFQCRFPTSIKSLILETGF